MIDPGTARGRFINARTWVSSAPHVGSFHGDAWTALVGVRKPVTNMKACFTAKATAPVCGRRSSRRSLHGHLSALHSPRCPTTCSSSTTETAESSRSPTEHTQQETCSCEPPERGSRLMAPGGLCATLSSSRATQQKSPSTRNSRRRGRASVEARRRRGRQPSSASRLHGGRPGTSPARRNVAQGSWQSMAGGVRAYRCRPCGRRTLAGWGPIALYRGRLSGRPTSTCSRSTGFWSAGPATLSSARPATQSTTGQLPPV